MESLKNLKILDFSTLLPGPYATMLLADLGADVLQISAKGKPDVAAELSPVIPEAGVSGVTFYLGRNKRNMYLNLKHPKAIEVVHSLIRDYDIVLEQFRPGVMDRLGLGYDSLKKVNPSLIYCSITGYGQNGAMRDRAGHDINYLARSGVMSYSGRQGTGPALNGMQIADVAAGSMNVVTGILTAVVHRLTTGEGQYVDIAMLDGMLSFNAMYGASFLANGKQAIRGGELLNGGSLYDFYETKDGGYLSVGSLEPKFFTSLCNGLGLPDLIPGTAAPPDLEQAKAKIRLRVLEKTRDEWMEIFDKLDACVEPVLTLEEALFYDDHICQRGMVVDMPLPLSEKKTVKQVANPIKLSATPPVYRHGAYPPGYHTQEVMLSLGYAEDRVQTLEKEGLFGG